MIDHTLLEFMEAMLRQTPTEFRRYAYKDIHWNNRLLGIVGARGVGKSTLVKQYLLANRDKGKFLYVSADQMYFTSHTLLELARELSLDGYTHLIIDEIHKYPNWSRELKNIYDTYRDLNVIFTGSSILDILHGEADLSRRAVVYPMYGLSFREYLKLFHNITVGVFSLEEIVNHKVESPSLPHPRPYFEQYLREGYYPFAVEGGFPIKMQQVISQTIESDIAQFAELKATTARKLKRLIGVIAESAPFKPNLSSLATVVGVSKNNIADYLVYMERAGLIGQLRDATGGIRGIGKVEKVYIDNPSLMTVLSDGHPNTGNLRETFFYTQTRVKNDIVSSKDSDFVIDRYTFEVGGKKKGHRQIENIENGYLVKDDIEFGFGNVIPLWHFGLNY